MKKTKEIFGNWSEEKKKNIFITIIVKTINFYQKTISPDHSMIWKSLYVWWYCRYYPSCSQYTKEKIEKYWFFKWWILWLKRILKCNPCSKWWIDN